MIPPFLIALCAYIFLAIYSHVPGRLPVGIWWSVQAVGWMSCAWFWLAARGRWPSTKWIIASALIFRCCGLWAPPTLENDFQRYLWDGWRTVHDGSPYVRAPVDFFESTESQPPAIATALNELNNPALPTIYAPVTEGLFAVAAFIAPGSLFALKLLFLGSDLVIVWLLLRLGGRSAAWFYAWCPLAITETAFHAHADGWAVMWLLLAWLCAKRERFFIAGLLAGVAIGAKIFAALAIPFLIWRRPARVLPAIMIALAVIYAPFFITGSAEWSSLRTMAANFQFNSFGYAALAVLGGTKFAHAAWIVLLAAIFAILVTRWVSRSEGLAEAPVASAWLAFLLLSPVVNPWYLIWLAPFVALRPTRAGLIFLVVVPLSYATGLNLADESIATFGQPAWVRPLEYGLVGVALLSDLVFPLTSRK